MQSDKPKIFFLTGRLFRQEDRLFLTGRHDVRGRDEEHKIYFAITDLADSSEASPLRELFSEKSAKSVIHFRFFLLMVQSIKN